VQGACISILHAKACMRVIRAMQGYFRVDGPANNRGMGCGRPAEPHRTRHGAASISPAREDEGACPAFLRILLLHFYLLVMFFFVSIRRMMNLLRKHKGACKGWGRALDCVRRGCAGGSGICSLVQEGGTGPDDLEPSGIWAADWQVFQGPCASRQPIGS